MEYITSRTNPLIAHIRKLISDGAYRREHGEFVCDGPKLFSEALQWGRIRTVIRTESADIPGLPSGIREIIIPADMMRSVAPSKTPQGVLTVCSMPEFSLPQVLTGRYYMALDGIQDPGNVGNILRTADAFGADGLFLLPGCADLFHPKTVRATMGALFRLDAWSCTGTEFAALVKRSGIPVYGAAARKNALNAQTLKPDRLVIAIGSEGQGLSEEMLNLCDETIRIPMRERCESLNAAMAAGIFLWEMFKNTDA